MCVCRIIATMIKKRFSALQLLAFCSMLPALFFTHICYAQRSPYAGERFQRETKLNRDTVVTDNSALVRFLPEEKKHKTYPGAVKIRLPFSKFKGLSLEEAIQKRRSARGFSGKALTLEQFSQLIYSAAGITGEINGFRLRAAPSQGETYPLEIYPLIRNVSGLKSGLYHYLPEEHSLELIKEADMEAGPLCMDAEELNKAGVVFFISALPERITSKFDIRGWRYIYMEAGHISQNIYLEAASLGLASVSIGSFYDDEVNAMLGIDGRNEFAIYAHAVGIQ